MKKYFIPVFFSFTLIGFVACKKCVTCKVKDAVGNTFYYAKEKCGTGAEVDQHEKDLLETYYCQNFTVRDSDGVVLYVTPQICGDYFTMRSTDSALYWQFIADSPSVTPRPLPHKVYCLE